MNDKYVFVTDEEGKATHVGWIFVESLSDKREFGEVTHILLKSMDGMDYVIAPIGKVYYIGKK